jgi:hypothetical protein
MQNTILPACNQGSMTAIQAMRTFLGAAHVPPDTWKTLSADAEERDTDYITRILDTFCTLYALYHYTTWAHQTNKTLKQCEFVLRRLPPTHPLYTAIVAWHTRLFALVQHVPNIITANPCDVDALDERLRTLKNTFRELVLGRTYSRFVIRRVRWLLHLIACCAKLTRISMRSERNEALHAMQTQWSDIDEAWGRAEAITFQTYMDSDVYKKAVSHLVPAADFDGCYAPIEQWIDEEQRALCPLTPFTSPDVSPGASSPLARVLFLPSVSLNESFDMAPNLFPGFMLGINDVKSHWLHLDFLHQKPSGIIQNEADMLDKWTTWLKPFAWQESGAIRSALTVVQPRYHAAIEKMRDIGMEWPTCMNKFYTRQLQYLQDIQRKTPVTTLEEFLYRIMCFHVLLTWLKAHELPRA